MHLSQTLFASSVPEIDGSAVSDGRQWDFQSALILCKTEAGARSSMQLLLVSDQERLVSLIRTIFIFLIAALVIAMEQTESNNATSNDNTQSEVKQSRNQVVS
jgi:hypothetical protein